ncbi:hypothetical protein [Nocardia sp. NPDC059239]|uniref:hypothetical protein n=1 Tax=unclassified Nocardia TaxID=2637762 RepID=UPI00369C54EA
MLGDLERGWLIGTAIQDNSMALFHNAFRDEPSANRNRAEGFRNPRGPRNSEAGPSPKVRPPEAIQVRLSWAVAGLAICSASLEVEQPERRAERAAVGDRAPGRKGNSLVEITSKTGIPKTSLHRYLTLATEQEQ